MSFLNTKLPMYLILLLVGLFFVTGMYAGSILQQEHFIKGAVKVAEGLQGSNFDVTIDINETTLIEGFRDILNDTMHIPKYQGPVRPGTDEQNFRETGISKPSNS